MNMKRARKSSGKFIRKPNSLMKFFQYEQDVYL